MANLALWGYNGADTNSYGFNHYFRDDGLGFFKSAMSAIQQNNDPHAPYTFIVNCSPTGDVLKKCNDGKGSYAITDATVPKDDNDIKSMWLCPLFFNGGADTKNDLPNTEDTDALNAWCNQKDYTLFPTAGHVILHEITHLDAVAKQWLPADDDGTHGTTDFAIGSKPIVDARRLKIQVDNDPNRDDVPAPHFNAESYAGAATELWAQKFCKKDFIPPKNGYQT
ncbi:hypothetical protein ACLMJK_007494 [Lecanora helva]